MFELSFLFVLLAATMSDYNAINFLPDYEGKNFKLRLANEDELLSPPGGPTCHPVNSNNQQCRKSVAESQQEADFYRKQLFELQQRWSELKKNEAKGSDDVMLKDSEIRRLQRMLTIRDAELHKIKGHTEKMLSEKHLLEERLKFEIARRENSTECEDLRRKNSELEEMVKQQREMIERLNDRISKNKVSIPSSSSLPSTNNPMTSSSIQSLNSSDTSYSQALEGIHAMVDTLRATALEQREMFSKISKLRLQSNVSSSQSLSNKMLPEGVNPSHNSTLDSNNASTTPSDIAMTSATNSQTLRLAEENNEQATNPLSGVQSFGGVYQVNEGTVSENSNPNVHPGVVGSALTGSGMLLPTVNSDYQLNAGSSVDEMTSSNGSLMSDPPVTAFAEKLVGPMAGLDVSSSSRNTYPLTRSEGQLQVGDYLYMNCSEHGHVIQPVTQKNSQSEVIHRISSTPIKLPAKSQTEKFGPKPPASPQHRALSQPSYHLYSGDQNIHPPFIATPHGRSQSTGVINPGATGTHLTYPMAAAFCIAPSPQYEISDINNKPGLPNPHTTGSNATNVHTNQQQQIQPAGNGRICPVCNQDYRHISMEELQTHVFDCFDNESGPETLQQEMLTDFPPTTAQGADKTCPMCQKKFPASITQSDFEKHVNLHFEEENFEVLGPSNY